MPAGAPGCPTWDLTSRIVSLFRRCAPDAQTAHPVALLSVVACGLVAAAAAAEPTARIALFKARAVPVPRPHGGTYPHTGNILGAGAAVEAEYVIDGSGYGATPQNPAGGIPPISQVNFFLPAGVRLHRHGFS